MEDRRMKKLNALIKPQGILVRKTLGRRRKYDLAAQLRSVLTPYSICTPDPYGAITGGSSGGSPKVHSMHRTLEEVEQRLRLLGVLDDSWS